MSVYKPYPKYKDSGDKWLGTIPDHWVSVKVKFEADIELSNVDKHSVEGEPPVKLCNYLDVYRNDFITDKIEFMDATATDEQIRRLSIMKGDVIITKDSEDPSDIGIPALVKNDLPGVVCGYHLAVIRPRKHLLGSYLHRCFSSTMIESYFETQAVGMTRYALGKSSINDIPIPLPPILEQQLIANFLDRETSRIDNLIQEQKDLIELLKEKRQALISNAVTKGLNPNAKTKNSGVEWIGEIPEHWNVKKLKHLIRAIESGVSTNSIDIPVNQGQKGVLKTSCVYNFVFNMSENKCVDDPIEIARLSCPVKKNTIIVSRMNTPELVGACGFVEEDNENLFLPDRLWLVSFTNKLDPKFAWLILTEDRMRSLIGNLATGTSGSMKNLSQSDFRDLSIPLPDRTEQQNIIEFLEDSFQKIDVLIETALSAVELMQEHRASLISEAVTGKIDVRGINV